jgi:hypothetical protein
MTFLATTSDHFEGNEGPNVAEAWLTDIGMLFYTFGCTDEQKVWYIGLNLTGKARQWGTSRKMFLSEPRKKNYHYLGVVQDGVQ